MTFARKNANREPFKDAVFAIAAMAKKDKEENGADNVTDATIGTLYGEDEKLVAFESVFEHYDTLDKRVKASYATSFTGNPDYREDVWKWIVQGQDIDLPHSVIATPGGTGAVSSSFMTFLDKGETIILPDIAWGSYKLMANQQNLNIRNYEMFDGDHFNLKSVQEAIDDVLKIQDRIIILVNDPCHNPTGYSMTVDEWAQLIEILNKTSEQAPVILIDDIAYIDYSYHLDHCRDYMQTWKHISDRVMIDIAFSCSKLLTSYGLRCGAAVMVANHHEDVREVEIVFEKYARANWSNISNSAMVNFCWIINDNRAVYLREKQRYVDLMKLRSDIFVKEAKEAGLPCYPYKEGFFVTVRTDNAETAKKFHAALMEHHIYTVLVNKGIRVACCSLPVNKVIGLAGKMKEIKDTL